MEPLLRNRTLAPRTSTGLTLSIPGSCAVLLPSSALAVPEFETLYDQYFRFVWASARRLGVTAEAMDDVVQEVFIVIHEKLHTVRQPESLRSWIYGIVRRTVSSHRRAGHQQRRVFSVPHETTAAAVPALQASPLELTEHSARLELLQALLASLTEAKREVFILCRAQNPERDASIPGHTRSSASSRSDARSQRAGGSAATSKAPRGGAPEEPARRRGGPALPRNQRPARGPRRGRPPHTGGTPAAIPARVAHAGTARRSRAGPVSAGSQSGGRARTPEPLAVVATSCPRTQAVQRQMSPPRPLPLRY